MRLRMWAASSGQRKVSVDIQRRSVFSVVAHGTQGWTPFDRTATWLASKLHDGAGGHLGHLCWGPSARLELVGVAAGWARPVMTLNADAISASEAFV